MRQVFWNVHEVLGVNQPLAERLTKRQKQQPVVQNIGDLFLERVAHFEPFVTYGAHQMFGKYEFEKEKGANLAFQKFVDVRSNHTHARSRRGSSLTCLYRRPNVNPSRVNSN